MRREERGPGPLQMLRRGQNADSVAATAQTVKPVAVKRGARPLMEFEFKYAASTFCHKAACSGFNFGKRVAGSDCENKGNATRFCLHPKMVSLLISSQEAVVDKVVSSTLSVSPFRLLIWKESRLVVESAETCERRPLGGSILDFRFERSSRQTGLVMEIYITQILLAELVAPRNP